MISRLLISFLLLNLSLFGQSLDSVKIEINNLGKLINSSSDDYAPIISADVKTLIFTSKRSSSENGRKKKKELENIYISVMKNGKWGEVSSISSNINVPKFNNSAISISNDGQHLLLYRDDKNGNGDIWQSFLKGKEWSEPERLPEPINSDKHESSASISPDGNTIYFVSDRVEGNLDIWYCTKDRNGKWGEAKNIGTKINTTNSEEGVFIHPDGKTLFYSSNGHGGEGQYDIFKSIFENGEWGKPINLGKPINTKNNDLFFVMAANGKKAFYSSSEQKENLGGKDLYEITFTPLLKEKSKGPSLTLLKGVVSDSISGTFIEAKIDVSDNAKNVHVSDVISNSYSGNYLVSLPAGKNYNITVRKEGYLFYSRNVSVPLSSDYQEIIKDIKLIKIKIGNKVVLENIFFEYGKTALRNESLIELNSLLKLLTENPQLKLEISGHTDNIGDQDFNIKLSEGRAKSVVEYLVKNGINSSRLTFIGYGFKNPISTNTTEEGRQLNRRVEFKVLEN